MCVILESPRILQVGPLGSAENSSTCRRHRRWLRGAVVIACPERSALSVINPSVALQTSCWRPYITLCADRSAAAADAAAEVPG